METYEQREITDEDTIRGCFGDPRLRGPFWQNGSWLFDLQYTAEAAASLRPVVTPRTELGSLPCPIRPIPSGLAQELGLPIPPQGSTTKV